MVDIKIQEFVRYLTLKGFKKRLDFPNNDLLVYRKPINEFNLDMVFPSQEDYIDYSSKIIDCINAWGKLEGKSSTTIIQEIKKLNIDNLEVSENVYELDDIMDKEANGVYVISSKDGANIRIREVVKYCEEQSKDSSELSEEELKQFIRD